jgi:WD40 repeat protein
MGPMVLLGAAVALLGSLLMHRPRLQIFAAAGVAVLLFANSDYLSGTARFSGFTLIAALVAVPYAAARGCRSWPVTALTALGVLSVIASLALGIDRAGRGYLGLDPMSRAARPSGGRTAPWSVEGISVVTVMASSEGTGLRVYGGNGGQLRAEDRRGTLPLVGDERRQRRCIEAIAFTPNGSTLAVADGYTTGKGGEVSVWDYRQEEGGAGTLVLRHLLRVEGHGVTALAFSPDGLRLAGGHSRSNLSVWDAESGEVLDRYCPFGPEDYGIPLRCLAFSPDGATMLVWSGDGLELWSVPKLNRQRSFGKWFMNPQSVEFAPDGHSFLARESDDEARWEVMPSPWPLAVLSGTAGAALIVLLATARPRPTASRTTGQQIVVR